MVPGGARRSRLLRKVSLNLGYGELRLDPEEEREG